MRASPRWVVAVALCWCAAAAANPPVEERLNQLNQALEAQPDVSLLLQRGELKWVQGDVAGALSDYDRAASINPDDARIPLLQGQALMSMGDAEAALAPLTRYVMLRPGDAEGHRLHARVLANLKRWSEAEASWQQAIELSSAGGGRPNPDDVLARAQAQAAQGDDGIRRAISALDAHMARFGALVVYQEAAVQLALARGDTPGAMGRLDALISHANRPERYLAQKGDALLQAGQFDEARAAFAQALSAMESLPAGRRAVDATQKLEAHIHAQLQAVGVLEAAGQTSP